ncbi:hypothetical protein K439DRAFT_1645139 [Ramaria rubella]|nr:hypothetical protein K439DRAFT_1645139 [Ramaria rubella]
MISTFQESTCKPVEDVLDQCYIAGVRFSLFSKDWLIDGVWSPELEHLLLGVDLSQIVKSLTFGWYESLLQSYYIGRKVKVVSSMGQQSMGKSCMINHLTDCSFQGSAMQTTEGCWMSFTPTDDFIVISLDFEGLDSIECSAQEDTLLVLLNTTISNLVLFRNNFAFFQSSSLVVNPASNPTLFQGTLAIIVKDIIDSDSKEIVKEFSQKLQHIVKEEQDLMVMPWPVIKSQKFYAMFHRLKKVFYSQPVTHPSAGVFLSTMKTLMAKLKTNDWGALDNNLSALRAQILERMLPTAFMYRVAEEGTDEPLKEMDTDTIIPVGSDSRATFSLQGYSEDFISVSAPRRLASLRETFISDIPREDAKWISTPSEHLDSLTEARIAHMQNWLQINSSRFSSHTDIMQSFNSR